MKSKVIFLFLLLISSIRSYEQFSNWEWAKKITGNTHIHANGIACDNIGNIYVLGASPTSTISFGIVNLTNSGCYIAKYDALGTVLWAKNINATSNSYINKIATDNLGNVYVTGHFDSPTITFGSIVLTNMGSEDIFIVKYDASGNVLWAKSAGGHDYDISRSITTDNLGNVYITGGFSSSSIIFGSTTLTNAGFMQEDVFIAKYDAMGNALWAKSAGGYLGDIGVSITTDNSNNIFVSGGFNSPAITFGSTTLANANPNPLPNDYDIFIAKYDASGNALWAKNNNNSSYFWGYNSIITDNVGNLYVIGNFDEPTISIGNFTLTKTGIMGTDFYIAKYDVTGNVLWAKSAGGSSWDYCSGISSDDSGNIYITGNYMSSVISFGNTTLNNSGSYDVYVAGYDTSGNILWAKSAGGNSDDNGSDISTDNFGNIYIVGDFDSPALTFGNTTLTNGGFDDVFVAKISTCNLPQPTIMASGPITFCTGDSVTLTSSPAYSYLWSSSAITQSVMVQTPGLYWVQISDINGCTAKDSIIIHTLPLPVVDLGNDTVICTDQIVPFSINAGNSGITYSWNTGATSQSIPVSSSGIYSVTVTDINACKSTDSITVTFKPALHVNLGNDSIMCPGDLLTLSPGAGFDTYLWSDGSTSQSLNINNPGIYFVIVGKDGCKANDEITIMECNSEIIVPNVLTPNGDGINDSFYPVCKNIDNMMLIIFNRWGHKIYESSGKTVAWDGKQSGKICPEGVYYYLLNYEEKVDGKRIIKKLQGSITLIK